MTGLGLAFRQMARDARKQRLRTLLTTFGIVWGTLAVSLLLAFGQGMHRHIQKSFAGLGDHIVIGWPARTSMPFEGLNRGRKIRMTDEDIAYLTRDVEGIAGISPEFAQNLKAAYGTTVRSVDVSGVAPVFGVMRNLIPAEGGRFINPTDMAERRRVVFVGNELAKDLFGAENPVGKDIMLHGSPFVVVGVLEPKEQDSSYSGRDHSKMFIPVTTFQAMTGRKYLDMFIYRADAAGGNKALTKRIVSSLGHRLRFDPGDTQAFVVWDTTEMFAFLDSFMLGFKIFLGVMGVLTLIVGGIGVSNIMNVVVEERTREIGIKMALGARTRAILSQFMLETAALTFVGGGIGLGLTFAVCAVFPRLGFTEYVGAPVISPVGVGATAFLLGLVAFLAGYFPARDAANLDPVAAMKI